MVLEQKYISAEAFWELIQQPEYANSLLELVDGEILEMVKPGGKHGVITMWLGYKVLGFVNEHDLGYVTAAETGYVLKRNPDGRDTIRGLDVGFIKKSRLPKGIPDGHIPLGPDLAVEVISPGNSADDIHQKILELFAAGTELIWIVFPKSKTVDVHTVSGAKTLHESDVLDGGTVLPGLKINVRDIFAR